MALLSVGGHFQEFRRYAADDTGLLNEESRGSQGPNAFYCT